MIVVARTSRGALVGVATAGVFAIVVGVVSGIGFSIRDGGWWPIVFGAWWVILGAIALSVNAKLWERGGTGLGIDSQGVHYWRDSIIHWGEHILIPWEDICGARAATFETEGPEKGLLLGLKESAPNPACGLLANIAIKQQKALPPWTNVALLHNCYWKWNPWEVQRQIEDMLERQKR